MNNPSAIITSRGERALETYIKTNFNSTFVEFKQLQMGARFQRKARRKASEELGLAKLNPASLNLPRKTHIYPHAYEGYEIREFLDSVLHLASEQKEEVLLGLVDAKNLGGVNDKYGLAAGDLYLLSCICIMRQIFMKFFENVTIVRRTAGDEFWLVCSVRKNVEQPLEELSTQLGQAMRQLETAVGFEVLENPKRKLDFGIGLHLSWISSLNQKIRSYRSLVHRWGEMIDHCESRIKTA